MYRRSSSHPREVIVLDDNDWIMEGLIQGRLSTDNTNVQAIESREHQRAKCSKPKNPFPQVPQTLTAETRKGPIQTSVSNYLSSSTWSFPTQNLGSSLSPHAALPIAPASRERSSNNVEVSGVPSTPLRSSRDYVELAPPQIVINDTTDDEDIMDEEDFAQWITQQNQEEMSRVSTTAADSNVVSRQKSSVILLRNPPLTMPLVSLIDFSHNDIRLSPKVYVELQDGDFMKIVHIIQDLRTSEVSLRGYIFRRTREMNGVLDRKLNEVCWIMHIDDDDPRDPSVQGLETVAVTEVLRRRHIRLTNLSFPALSFREETPRDTGKTVENERVLVCRYKYLCFYPNAKARTQNAWCEKGFHRLRAEECDKRSDNNVKDEDLRSAWRGLTSLGGGQEGWLPGEKEFLRQEGISHRGITSYQSLKIPSGVEFPPGDPMKRGAVGRLLYERDLRSDTASKTPRDPAPKSTTKSHTVEDISLMTASDADDEIEEVGSPSPSTRTQQRRYRRTPRASFTAFTDCLDPSDNDSDGGSGMMFALSRGLRESSIHATRRKHLSPRVIMIDAQVKTYSGSGTYKKRYEGKMTETYFPKLGPFHRKRTAGQAPDSLMRPSKRTNIGSRQGSSHPAIRDVGFPGSCVSHHRPASTSDSDKTLGHSQPEDSVEEMCTPEKARGYEAAQSGLMTPLSLRRNGSVRPIYPDHGELATPSRKARLSTTAFRQSPRLEENEDDLVDLTRPQYHQSTLSTHPSRFSASRQIDMPARLRSGPNVSANLHRNPLAPRVSCQMPSSTHYRNAAPTPLPSRSSSHRPRPNLPLDAPIPSGLESHLRSSTNGLHERSQTNVHQRVPVKRVIQKSSKEIQRRYTFGDCYSGVGGMSRGAVMVGLRVAWAFDFNLTACQGYSLNFFGTPVYNVWANEFAGAKREHKVDFCHLSPPCQFFSDAHTHAGKDDEMNTASLFAIFNLLEKAKPRVVTLEQTSGLIRRHPIYFNSVVNMFTARGFSVRWRVMNCADFGLAQRRMRLFIIASCPGEALPPFPRPTHSANPSKTGLKPWTTINQAISSVPSGWDNHDVHLAKERNASPQSGDKIATCVTTSGGGIIHPSGKRDYTHREFACLQSFPLGHKFGTSGVKKQIGNAVPPMMAAVLLEEVKQALLRADGLA